MASSTRCLLNVEDVELRDELWIIPRAGGQGPARAPGPGAAWVQERLDLWTTSAKIRERRIFRAVRKNGWWRVSH